MTIALPMLISLVVGLAAGAAVVLARSRGQREAQRAEIAALRVRLESAAEQETKLAEMRLQASSMRHDLRGILSPALLCADRLASSQDAAVRKAADIVIRCVDRATVRLADKEPAQAEVNSAPE